MITLGQPYPLLMFLLGFSYPPPMLRLGLPHSPPMLHLGLGSSHMIFVHTFSLPTTHYEAMSNNLTQTHSPPTSFFPITLRIRLVGGVKKWEDKKDLVFSHLCLVGRMEKWRDRKLICLVEKKIR